MNFYKGVFGGDLTFSTFGSMDQNCPAEFKDQTMHSSLENDRVSFMASDNPPGEAEVKSGNMRITVAGPASDDAKLAEYFSELKEG